MATKMQAFTNREFGTLRTITWGGQIVFCGKDVATALGYTNPSKALQDHCEGVPFHYPLETSGSVQQIRFISEGDLYRLIFSSKLPAARAFETWVAGEVLPAIRRHGVYAMDKLLDNGKFREHAVSQLRFARAKRLVAEQALLETASKVAYCDLVLQSKSLLTITEIAKDYGLSAKRLNQILREEQVQFCQSGRWFLYDHFAERGYTQSKTYEYDAGKTRTHMYWTQKGRLFIYNLLKNERGLLPVIERAGKDA